MKKLTVLLALVIVSCASSKPSPVKTACDQQQPSESYQRNHRYATVYNAFDEFKWLDRLLIVKMESKAVHDVIEDLSNTGKKIKEQLDELQKANPSLSFEDHDRSEVSVRKSKLQSDDRIKSFLPIVGKHGQEFERSLLLFVANTTNELKYRLQALSDLEKTESLKKFDDEMHDQAMRLEDRCLKLLNEKYFKKNYFKPQTPDKK